jgi:hypothetical protein
MRCGSVVPVNRSPSLSPKLALLSSFVGVLHLTPLNARDCNVNQIEDADDIAAATSEDCNLNGVPDECEFLPIALGATGESLVLSHDAGAAASADLNQDGVSDLAIGTSDLNRGASLMTFLSEGSRNFAPEALFDAGSRVVAMEAADIDQDGDVDLVTNESSSVIVLSNHGDGTFASPVKFAIPVGSRGLLVADLSGDGRLDFLTRSRRLNSVTWLPNPHSDGGLAGSTFPVVADPVTFAAADFDGDGHVDLAVAGEDDQRLSVLVQRPSVQGEAGLIGDRVLEEWVSLPTTSFGELGADDLNGDGLPDLVLGGRETLSIWFNPGNGRFDEVSEFAISAHQLLLVDVDEDGSHDLLAGAFDLNTLQLVRNNGDGTFRPPQPFSTDFRVMTAADYDADGDVDLAFPASAPSIVTIYWQGETSVSGFSQEILDAVHRPHGIAAGDLTGDGSADILTSNSGHQTYSLFTGRGDGTFEPASLRNLGETLSAVAIDDFDHDGTKDAMFRTTSGLRVFLNPAATGFDTSTTYPSRGDFQFLATADVDGDGFVDALVPLVQQQTLTVHFNDRSGGYSERQGLVVRPGPRAARAGDLDGDGDADLATANRRASSVSLLFQVSPKEFSPARTLPVVGGPHDLQIGDFNLDGRMDIAVANQVSEDIAIFWSTGGGDFSDPVRFPIHRAPFGLWAGDLTADGLTELITTNESNQSVTILQARPGGNFAPPQSFSTGIGPRFTVTLDADNDGDLDLTVANRRSAEISVILNHLETPDAGVDAVDSVCTTLDFERLSAFGLEPRGTDKSTYFLLAAVDDPSLPRTTYANANRISSRRDLLATSSPDRFGDLTEAGFLELVSRRANRQFYAGTISRLTTAVGTVYGVDFVVAESPEETLRLDEVRAAFAVLRTSFLLLPLAYAPSATEAKTAAANWVDPGFELLLLDDAEPPDPVVAPGTPTFTLEIPAETTLCGVFVEANANRGPRDEYLAKSTVRLRPGDITLTTTAETLPHELFEEVLFGPDQERAEPQSAGEFRVQSVPGLGGVTVFRFLYSQPFVLPSGSLLELEIVAPLEFGARGDEPLESRRSLPPEYHVTQNGLEPMQATLDGVPLVRYGSCSYETLSLWSIEATLEDGTSLRLTERFDEAESLLVTAPAAVLRAELEFPGSRRVVTKYTDLVYSGFRHNEPVDYWVVLNPPVQVENVGEVHGVELLAPAERLRPDASANYLGANLEPLARVEVRDFLRRQISRVDFRRGDVDTDSRIALRDAIVLVEYLFRGGNISCRKAADANDDGKVDVVDAILVASQLFGEQRPLPPPFPECGEDPTVDRLDCRVPTICE